MKPGFRKGKMVSGVKYLRTKAKNLRIRTEEWLLSLATRNSVVTFNKECFSGEMKVRYKCLQL